MTTENGEHLAIVNRDEHTDELAPLLMMNIVECVVEDGKNQWIVVGLTGSLVLRAKGYDDELGSPRCLASELDPIVWFVANHTDDVFVLRKEEKKTEIRLRDRSIEKPMANLGLHLILEPPTAI